MERRSFFCDETPRNQRNRQRKTNNVLVCFLPPRRRSRFEDTFDAEESEEIYDGNAEDGTPGTPRAEKGQAAIAGRDSEIVDDLNETGVS